MDRGATYRANVADCLARAREAREAASEQLFIEMALIWHRLALVESALAARYPDDDAPVERPNERGRNDQPELLRKRQTVGEAGVSTGRRAAIGSYGRSERSA
jgi:hypothetical protein